MPVDIIYLPCPEGCECYKLDRAPTRPAIASTTLVTMPGRAKVQPSREVAIAEREDW